MHKSTRPCGRISIAVLLVIVIALSTPTPAIADGGPILSNPQQWADLEEGQQIAVVKLNTGNTAHVDLFISMLDNSGESHEVVFFLPLGYSPSEFNVEEKTSVDFDDQLTDELDEILETETRRVRSYRRSVQASLLLGTLFINGGWSWPVWIAVLLGGCTMQAGTPAPLATFETESSQVAIYGVDGDTDLQALIDTTGLDPSVRETLERQRGRQIAVITLQTQPPPEKGSGSRREPAGQPGIHLAWETQLISHSEEASYTYPFGTGSAWAHPIELTRVYVVAPPGVDFSLQYPELGRDLSGFVGGFLSEVRPRIIGAGGTAHAVENAVGAYGRVWRITYLESNSDQDVIITRLAEISPVTRDALWIARNSGPVLMVTWMVALLVAFGLWLTAWRYVMPRFLGIEYRWLGLELWRDALLCAIATPFTNPAAVLAALVLALGSVSLNLSTGIMVLVVTLFALLTLFLFVQVFKTRAEVSGRRAALGYIVVVVAVNAVYLPLAVGYAALVGVL